MPPRKRSTRQAEAEAAPLTPEGEPAPAAEAADAAAPLAPPVPDADTSPETAPPAEDAAPLTPPEPDADLVADGGGQDTAAAPLEPPAAPAPPADDKPDILPAPPVPAPYPGRRGLDLRHQDGTPVDVGGLFDDPGPRFTYVTVRHRLFEWFTYDGSHEPSARLLYPAGRRVSRHEAAMLAAEVAAFQQSQQ